VIRVRRALYLIPLFALPLLGLVPRGGAASYAEGPPTGHTGGFNEPTCQACHFDNPLDEPSGSLALRGVSGSYEPGETYRIAIELVRPGMQRAGFQVALRYAEGARRGEMAGVLSSADGRSAVVASPQGVRYAQQTATGTGLAAPDTATWTVVWRAPAEGGAVVAHLVGNAANGDQSEFGDHIYTRELRLTAGARAREK
jgi:hypothetical protein